MSYGIDLLVGGKVAMAAEKHGLMGGTYVMGGTRELSFNITYNYAKTIYQYLPGGIPGLEGKTVRETKPLIVKAINELLADVIEERVPLCEDPDYWKETPGNVLKALMSLVDLAHLAPDDAVWSIH